jgi:hypothetical protein
MIFKSECVSPKQMFVIYKNGLTLWGSEAHEELDAKEVEEILCE